MGDWYNNISVQPAGTKTRIEELEQFIKTQEMQTQLNCMMSNQLVYEKNKSHEYCMRYKQLQWKLITSESDKQKAEEKIMELEDHMEDLKESCKEYQRHQSIQNTQLEYLNKKLSRQLEDYLKLDSEYKTKQLYIDQQASTIKDLESSVEINRNSKDEYMRLVEDVVRQNKMLAQQQMALSLGVCDQSSNTDDAVTGAGLSTPTETLTTVDGCVQTCLPTAASQGLMCRQQTQTDDESAPKISQHCQCDLNAESDASESVKLTNVLADCWSLCDSVDDLARRLPVNYEAKIAYCRQAVHELLGALRIKNEENELLRRACAESMAVAENLCKELERVRQVADRLPKPETDVADFTAKLLAETKQVCLDICSAHVAEEMEKTARSSQVVRKSGGELCAANDSDTVTAKDKVEKCRPAKRGKRHEKGKCEKPPPTIRYEKKMSIDQGANDPTAALGDLLTNVVPDVLAKIHNGKTNVVRRANVKVLLSKIAATGFGSLTFQELSFLHHKIVENSVEHFQKYKSLIDIATKDLPSWQRSAMSSKQDIVHLFAIMEGVLIKKDEDFVKTSSAVAAELADIKDLLVSTVREKQNIEKQLATTKADNERLLKKLKKSQWTHSGCFQERVTCMKSCIHSYLTNIGENGDSNTNAEFE